MKLRPSFARLAGVAVAVASLAASPATGRAATWRVPRVPGAAAAALARAADGDTVLLTRGVHAGPLRLTRRVTLIGEPGAIVDGGGSGSVVTVTAGGVRIERLSIRRSGDSSDSLDAGVRLAASPGARLSDLRLDDVRYGIAAERCDGLEIEGCTLTGRVIPSIEAAPEMDVAAGNGVHVWYSRGASVRGTSIRAFMDGIYLSFADSIRVEGCSSSGNGRYGLHTMYCQDNRIERNRFVGNIAGCAIMFSNHLDLYRNDFLHNRGPRTYGILLRDCSDGAFRENRLVDNTVAVFMDDSNRNRIAGNLVQDDGWGLILFSSCAGNVFTGNDFTNIDYPVALDMRRTDNQFDDGARGNYWSASEPYDLNGDGIGDVPYSPVSAFAFLSKQYPDLAIFGESPAATALSLAERTIPALRPSEAVDRYPLVRPAGAGVGSGAVDPARGGGAASAPASMRRAAPRGPHPAAAGFLLLAGAGAFGVARNTSRAARRRRDAR
ncbi:MAG: nitrous oxide reductase family maturation protein NosD [Bacteroidota bacterium]